FPVAIDPRPLPRDERRRTGQPGHLAESKIAGRRSRARGQGAGGPGLALGEWHLSQSLPPTCHRIFPTANRTNRSSTGVSAIWHCAGWQRWQRWHVKFTSAALKPKCELSENTAVAEVADGGTTSATAPALVPRGFEPRWQRFRGHFDFYKTKVRL